MSLVTLLYNWKPTILINNCLEDSDKLNIKAMLIWMWMIQCEFVWLTSSKWIFQSFWGIRKNQVPSNCPKEIQRWLKDLMTTFCSFKYRFIHGDSKDRGGWDEYQVMKLSLILMWVASHEHYHFFRLWVNAIYFVPLTLLLELGMLAWV